MKTKNNTTACGEIREGISYEDFKTVFKVFEDYPFCESWKQEEVRDEYDSFFQKKGNVFGYYLDGKCVAILTLHPIERGEHPVEFDEKDKVMYLSDVATLTKFRNRGIGTQLFSFALRHCKDLGYDYIYLRTNYDEAMSMSAGIAKKVGFERIYDACQEVERERVNGKAKKDLRMFMRKKL